MAFEGIDGCISLGIFEVRGDAQIALLASTYEAVSSRGKVSPPLDTTTSPKYVIDLRRYTSFNDHLSQNFANPHVFTANLN